MRRTQTVHQRVCAASYVSGGRKARAHSRKEEAIAVPFQVGDVIFRQQAIELFEQVVTNVVSRHIQPKLVSHCRPVSIASVYTPVRMLAIKVAVRVHHLGLDPDAEIHSEPVHMLN